METTLALAVGPPQPRVSEPRAGRATVHLTTRLIRRGALAISAAVGVIMVLEGFAFTSAYPDEASRAALILWGQDPGIRMMTGPATAVETLGGFAIWDSSIYVTLILAVWVIATTTRVLRGDETAGRADVLLSGPIRPAHVLFLQLLALLGTCFIVGLVIALALALSGAQVWGAVLFGAVMAGYCGAMVGVASLTSQVFATRVGAVSAAGAVLVLATMLRTVSNSGDSRAWLGWLTPLGWTDQLRAFGDNRWPVLLVPLVVTIALVGASVVVRRHRDTGEGLLVSHASRRSRRWGLSSPMAFAWRANLGVLLAWGAGVAAAGLVVGALLPTVEQYLATDASYRDMLVLMGMDVTQLTLGFVGLWATLLGLVIALYSVFRMGATRAEEASTRADFLLSRPVRRWRWLGGHVVCVVASVALLCAAAGAVMWLAGLATGAKISASDAFGAMFNTLPMVTVFVGLSVLVFGVAPRLTVVVGAAAAVVAYVLQMVGPALKWPDWLVGVSPFHHLEAVPVDPFGWPAAIVMVAIGVGLMVAGIVAFQRRDLVGA
ncbi:MAG: hypothetical protein WCP28_16715 [Actinomycetes bacterium]